MAVTPINVATRGLLDSPLSVSVDGYLSLGGVVPPVIPEEGGGSAGKTQRKVPPRIIVPPAPEPEPAVNPQQNVLAIAMLLAVYFDNE